MRESRAVEALVAAIPDARVVVLDEVSHNLPVEATDVLVQVMNEFLRDLSE